MREDYTILTKQQVLDIDWFSESTFYLLQANNGYYIQASITVNPYQLEGIMDEYYGGIRRWLF